jgi:hypothetical protein
MTKRLMGVLLAMGALLIPGLTMVAQDTTHSDSKTDKRGRKGGPIKMVEQNEREPKGDPPKKPESKKESTKKAESTEKQSQQ